MTIGEIVAELSAQAALMPEEGQRAPASKAGPVRYGPFTLYLDSSKNIDALVTIGGIFTGEDSPYFTGIIHTMPRRTVAGTNMRFEDGDSYGPVHTHNFAQFDYIVKGKLYTEIEGREYVFNQGEVLFLNRDTKHGEHFYHRDLTLIHFLISYSFFDKSLRLDAADEETSNFLRRFIIEGKRDFFFIRFIPKPGSVTIPPFLENICAEFLRPAPGGNYLIIGLVERFLDALPRAYRYVIEWNDHLLNRQKEFEEIRAFVETEYRRVTVGRLIERFGRSVNYYNQLIKSHTGLTYTEYVRNIRLEKAEQLLAATRYSVEEIARQVGYNNVSHFYKLFYEKFHALPKEFRGQVGGPP